MSTTPCPCCSKPVTQTGGRGRPKEYCSKECATAMRHMRKLWDTLDAVDWPEGEQGKRARMALFGQVMSENNMTLRHYKPASK